MCSACLIVLFCFQSNGTIDSTNYRVFGRVMDLPVLSLFLVSDDNNWCLHTSKHKLATCVQHHCYISNVMVLHY